MPFFQKEKDALTSPTLHNQYYRPFTIFAKLFFKTESLATVTIIGLVL